MIATTSVFKFATSHEICAVLGARVRIQRRIQKWSQGELAALAGIDLVEVQKLEMAGDASMDAVVRVARALGLTGGFIDLLWPEPYRAAGNTRLYKMAKQAEGVTRRAGKR